MAHTARRSLLAGLAATVGCALALSACSGATPGAVTPAAVATPTAAPALIAPSPSPTIATSAPGTVPAGSGRTVSESEFFSPSRNITCGINYQSGSASNGVVCQTLSPRQSVKMSGTGAFTTCTGANCLVGDAGEGTPVLAYGETSRVGPFACVSESSGVTCTVSDRGFTIARAGIVGVGGSRVSTSPPVQAVGLASIAGTWNRHEVSLIVGN